MNASNAESKERKKQRKISKKVRFQAKTNPQKVVNLVTDESSQGSIIYPKESFKPPEPDKSSNQQNIDLREEERTQFSQLKSKTISKQKGTSKKSINSNPGKKRNYVNVGLKHKINKKVQKSKEKSEN